MYAIVSTGGKQYKVKEGDSIKVEKLAAEQGAQVDFEQVLLVGDGNEISVGTPFVSGAKVSATVEAHGRAKKVHILKFRRRKHHMKRAGHRQSFTQLRITGIVGAAS